MIMAGVDNEILDYRADTLGVISALLHGYSGGITIVREMAQNADDVPGEDERWLEFHFNADALVIKNNTRFRDIDFQNIINIARGGKKREQRNTIGAFGVGFVSVYQLTDTPILRSSGRAYHFIPEHGKVIPGRTSVQDHTEFELRYRRQRSVVGDMLEMPAVTNEWVQQILQQLPTEAYRLLFFLRRLSCIAIYHNGLLICNVRREVIPGTPEQLLLTVTDAKGATIKHTWLRFTGKTSASSPLRDDGRPAKDNTVHLVIPDHNVPDEFLHQHVQGRLYNYLPTDIDTRLPFQINGDFFPSTDRKSIDNDHPNHREWNKSVLEAVGQCLANALPVLLERFKDKPLQLYQRLPIKEATPLVAPIRLQFFEAARALRIFCTSGGWAFAEDARWAAKDLRPVVKGVDSRLMAEPLQNAAWELAHKLGVRQYTLSDFLNRLSSEIKLGHLLKNGPLYLRSREALDTLYTVLEHESSRQFDAQIAQAPIFIDHTGKLWPASHCVRSINSDLRKTLADSGLHFWDGDAERFRYTAAYVPIFTLPHVWQVIGDQVKPGTPIGEAPNWLSSVTKLYRLYATILDTRELIKQNDVALLPICLDRSQRLQPPTQVFLPSGKPVLYDILADDPDAPLVAKPTSEIAEHRQLYEKLGVASFGWERLMDRIAVLAPNETPVTEAHLCLNSREKLIRLYRYLNEHRTLFTEADERRLQQLPIWLCRDNVLRAAANLALPPDTSAWPECITINTVIPIERSEKLHPLFEDTLGLRTLNTERFISQYLLPQYQKLRRLEQVDVLQYLRRQISLLRENQQLLSAVKAAPLIYGDDEKLQCPADLCFPRSQLRNIFPDRFLVPEYKLYGSMPDNAREWVWYDLFSLLGVNHYASASVIIDEIHQLTKRPPRQTRESIEKIFRYVELNWDRIYSHNNELLVSLREQKWLPADGDGDHWYRPRDLYQRQDKPLVHYVAKVLGFSESRRPQKGISDALQFPTTVEIKHVVSQLLALSARGEPAGEIIYSRLNSATADELKPLQGQAVVYAGERYWKADHIFLSNQTRYFGKYRGYVTDSESHTLLRKLGVREAPTPEDYLALIQEISQAVRDHLPPEEILLVRHAYSELAELSDEQLAPLKVLPCVLSSTNAESDDFALRLPEAVVLQPPQRYLEYLPNLPVAHSEARGESTLRRIGVRDIEDVLEVEFPYVPDTSHSFPISSRFSGLHYALKRLLHANHALDREVELMDRLKRLEGYYLPSVQVKYHVRLGKQQLSSALLTVDFYYDRKKLHVYLHDRFTQQPAHRPLAQILHQVLGIDGIATSLLKDLIAEPRNAREILDDNHIRPLPVELDIQEIEEPLVELRIGATNVEEADAETVVLNVDSNMDDELFPEFFDHVVNSTSPTAPSVDVVGTDKQNYETISPLPSLTQEIAGRDPLLTKLDREQQGDRGQNGRGNARHTSSRTDSRAPRGAAAPSIGQTGPTTRRSPTPNADGRSPTPAGMRPVAPRFRGRTNLASPRITTDMDGLRERLRHWIDDRGISPAPTEDATNAKKLRLRTVQLPAEPQESHIARFVLSYAEVNDGFLRITGKARNLFVSKPQMVQCVTDFHHSFLLWLSWERDTPIAYNQDALPAFFSEQEIPAGGIVYLERTQGDRYRLFYNQDPHTVREVRFAQNDQGQVRYEVIDEVEVRCETDEAIYRAEKRHEDPEALWLEAAGKKSVEESLCDLFMASPEIWIHQDDLTAMLAAERMVAAPTVYQTLRSQSFFVDDGAGYWRLDPQAILNASQNDIVRKWYQVTTKLIRSEDSVLAASLETLRPPLNDLRQRLLGLEAALPRETIASDELQLMAQLNEDPSNELIVNDVVKFIRQRIDADDVDLVTDNKLRELFRAATPVVREQILRLAIRDELHALQKRQQYERGRTLVETWADFDSGHGFDLRQIMNDAAAWSCISSGQPTVTNILKAIELSPTLTIARGKLHAAVQRELQQYAPEYWLGQGNDEDAVVAFFMHIEELGAGRQMLQKEEQKAFDTTVAQEAYKLWEKLNHASKGQLMLQLRSYAPTATCRKIHVEHILRVAEEHTGFASLLLGISAWKLAPTDVTLRSAIAAHIGASFVSLEMWELVNLGPWKEALDAKLLARVREERLRHNRTHVQRQQGFLAALRHADLVTWTPLLAETRQYLVDMVERDLEKLVASAA